MVAYGTTLKRSRRLGWEAAYVDYDALRTILERLEDEGMVTTDESHNGGGAATVVVDEDLALQLENQFLALLRKEIEKVSLFTLGRQGEIAEAIGSLRFEDDSLTIVARTVPVPSSTRALQRANSDEEDKAIASQLGEEAALLPSGSIVTGPLKTPSVTTYRKTLQQQQDNNASASRPLFRARDSLMQTYTASPFQADQYTEQGVELLHVLRYICMNAMAL